MSGIAKVYTPAAIERILTMKAKGANSAQIARAIGTTERSLNARASQLGLFRRKPIEVVAA
jgi:transcriptional regulator